MFTNSFDPCFGPYISALESSFGFTRPQAEDESWLTVVDQSQIVSIGFDPPRQSIRISAILRAPLKTLSVNLLQKLLEFNFPNQKTSGASLGWEPELDQIVLINDFLASSVEPRHLVDLIGALGRSAIEMDAWIEEQIELENMPEETEAPEQKRMGLLRPYTPTMKTVLSGPDL